MARRAHGTRPTVSLAQQRNHTSGSQPRRGPLQDHSGTRLPLHLLSAPVRRRQIRIFGNNQGIRAELSGTAEGEVLCERSRGDGLYLRIDQKVRCGADAEEVPSDEQWRGTGKGVWREQSREAGGDVAGGIWWEGKVIGRGWEGAFG